MKIDDYTLGIIWSIGSFQEGRFVFRHRDKYYLKQIQKYFNNSSIYKQIGTSGKIQHVLKTTAITPDDLPEWYERNADQRDVPILDDYKEFLRAYFELHSCLDYCTAYSNYGKKNQRKYKRLRLRVYGNYALIESINNILSLNCRVQPKSVQMTHNNKTAYLQYTSIDEITEILNWLTGEPNNKEFWQDIDVKLREPVKYVISDNE